MRPLATLSSGSCSDGVPIPTHRSIAVMALIPTLGFWLLAPALSSAQGVTPQSVITTVAGSSWVFRGDGGPAIDAPLGRLEGVVVDSIGNVFAADSDNHRVVKISATGILTVVAGNGLSGFSGDGGPATSASFFLSKVWRWMRSATFTSPTLA